MGKSLTIATQRNYSGNGFQREHEGSRKFIRDRHSSATCTGGSSSFHIQDALADEHATCAVGSQLLIYATTRTLSPGFMTIGRKTVCVSSVAVAGFACSFLGFLAGFALVLT